jgi:hypothetical protein
MYIRYEYVAFNYVDIFPNTGMPVAIAIAIAEFSFTVLM